MISIFNKKNNCIKFSSKVRYGLTSNQEIPTQRRNVSCVLVWDNREQ